MIDGKYDVVFRGQIVKNIDPQTVRSNLVVLFKSSPEAIERLFSGAESTIRKGLDYAAAMKYQAALRNAGALALIKEVKVEATPSSPEPRPAAQARASFISADPQSETETTSQAVETSPVASQSVSPSTSQPQEDTSITDELSLAQVGARILPAKVYEKREVDTSELSLAAAGERLIPAKAPEKYPEPKIDHLAITDDTTPIGGD